MKILVISDTHGYIGDAVEAIEKEKCDFCIHLGDMAADCEELELIFPRQKFIFVKGNNDFFLRDSAFPDERIFELGGKKFFVCHGHKYHVKGGLFALKKKAVEVGADIVLYGHTHTAYLETGSVLVMNPGSAHSYGLIHIDGDSVRSEICR
ncbi:MAG: metallophosphoesterase [Clostridia bacterium]|nr:metallophosphoesterase [Clostridia bacterium]